MGIACCQCQGLEAAAIMPVMEEAGMMPVMEDETEVFHTSEESGNTRLTANHNGSSSDQPTQRGPRRGE